MVSRAVHGDPESPGHETVRPANRGPDRFLENYWCFFWRSSAAAAPPRADSASASFFAASR